MDLPKNEKTFTVDITGETTGQQYQGEFTVVCVLNMLKRRQLELEKTRLKADTLNPTAGLEALAQVMSHLRVRIINGPEWWKQSEGGLNIMDENVIVELYDKCLEQELAWVSEVKDKGQKASQGNAKAETTT